MLKQVVGLLFNTSFLFSILRVTAPILFAALGGLMAKRAGILNIALESMMLSAALTGVVVSAKVKLSVLGGLRPVDPGYAEVIGKANMWGTIAGFLAAALVATLLGLFLGLMGIQLKANVYLAGLAMNTMATGGTVFILYLAAGEKGISSSLPSTTMPIINIPIIKDIPIIGEIFSGHNIMVYLAFLCVPIVYVLIMKTTMGLRIRAVGENPDAAESVGVNVKKVQFQALALSGFFAGLGGITMSMAYLAFFSRGMTAGRGFISMSAMNLGNATPVGTALAALLFGMFDAMGNVLQTLSFPSQFIQMIPYAATLVGLVVFAIQTERRLKKIKMEEENQ